MFLLLGVLRSSEKWVCLQPFAYHVAQACLNEEGIEDTEPRGVMLLSSDGIT